MGQNEFSDLTNDEFKHLKLIHSIKFSDSISDKLIERESTDKRRIKRQGLSANFDWRSAGKIAGVQDQG